MKTKMKMKMKDRLYEDTKVTKMKVKMKVEHHQQQVRVGVVHHSCWLRTLRKMEKSLAKTSPGPGGVPGGAFLTTGLAAKRLTKPLLLFKKIPNP